MPSTTTATKKKTLHKSDYAKILKFYNKRVPKTSSTTRKNAIQILNKKLCSCIKKVSDKMHSSEPSSIGICTSSVINRKGLTRGKFRCKKPRNLTIRKR